MPVDKLYFVNVGPQGTFRPSGAIHTTPADVDAIFAHLESRQITKLTVHFHGGLISEKSGAEIAGKMTPLYQAAGSHPVTFVWETGLVETVTRNLGTIQHTGLFKKILGFVLKKATKKLGIDPLGKGAGAELSDADIEAELAKTDPFGALAFQAGAKGGAAPLGEGDLQTLRQEVEAELEEDLDGDADFQALLETEAPATPLLNQDALVATPADQQKGVVTLAKAAKALAGITVRVTRRFFQERDHGFYPTVVEEILRELYVADLGEWVWGGMKTVAGQMWSPNDGLAGDDRHAGRYFLERLADVQRQTGITVDLVGHSAGSIAICEMLRAAAKAQLDIKVRHILFLAPACRSDLFFEEVVKHKARYASFRSFTMLDSFETHDRLVNPIYTRSLLYFISGVLEPEVDAPLAGMERYLSGRKPYDDAVLSGVRAFLLEPGLSRLVLSVTGGTAGPGLQSASTSHGGFDDDDLTRASLAALIAE